MSNLFTDIETLKKVVKINASMPWESIEPYVADALDIYIEPQIGSVLVEKAEEQTDPTLTEKVRRALGPLTMALATDELGIQFGDAGITVQNDQGKRSPANEAKIAAAKSNLFYRGMEALDRLLSYLNSNQLNYPDYRDHLATLMSVPCFIVTAESYQNVGLVNIDYSTLTFRTLLPTLRQLQETDVRPLMTDALYDKLLSNGTLTSKEIALKALVIRYMANKSAELVTSQTSREQRAQPGSHPEYQPLIRPLYGDLQDTGNWFALQANTYMSQLQNYLNAHAEELGITPGGGGLKYNSKEKKIFTSIV